MSRKKQKKHSFFVRLEKLLAIILGPGRPVLIVGVVAAVLLAGGYAVWQKVRPNVLSSDSYILTPQDVQITPTTPDWIHTDIRTEVFRSASLDGPLSIMDDNLTERVADAFSMHPWIAKVSRVTKKHPARVCVEVAYRRPVCMVEVPGGLFPVDAGGVLLPVDDFSPVEASRYPCLVGIDTAPVGITGESWGDTRVVGGAEIAAALGNVWNELKLSQIIPSQTGIGREFSYTLLTRGGTRIHWGLPPGANAPGELSAVEKIARLQKYLERHGTLEGRDAPQELDVRSM
jgi:hypothetical protein